jgi:Family of unknown function (DUF5989)
MANGPRFLIWLWIPLRTAALTLDALVRHGLSWLVPFVVVLLVLAILLVLFKSASVLAPFVYPLL